MRTMPETQLFQCECGDALRCVKPLEVCSKCGKENGYELVEE